MRMLQATKIPAFASARAAFRTLICACCIQSTRVPSHDSNFRIMLGVEVLRYPFEKRPQRRDLVVTEVR